MKCSIQRGEAELKGTFHLLPNEIICSTARMRKHSLFVFKVIFSDFQNIFLWHESKDINQKSLFPTFQLIPSLHFQVMHDYVCFIAPIDYCVE